MLRKCLVSRSWFQDIPLHLFQSTHVPSCLCALTSTSRPRCGWLPLTQTVLMLNKGDSELLWSSSRSSSEQPRGLLLILICLLYIILFSQHISDPSCVHINQLSRYTFLFQLPDSICILRKTKHGNLQLQGTIRLNKWTALGYFTYMSLHIQFPDTKLYVLRIKQLHRHGSYFDYQSVQVAFLTIPRYILKQARGAP